MSKLTETQYSACCMILRQVADSELTLIEGVDCIRKVTNGLHLDFYRTWFERHEKCTGRKVNPMIARALHLLENQPDAEKC